MNKQPPFVVHLYGVYRPPVLAQLLIVEVPTVIALAVSWWIAGKTPLVYLIGVQAVAYFLWWVARRHNQNLPWIQRHN